VPATAAAEVDGRAQQEVGDVVRQLEPALA